MATSVPRLAINDSFTAANSPISPNTNSNDPTSPSSTLSPIDPTARRLTLLRQLRAPPFKYSWTLWHDRSTPQHSSTSSEGSKYADRLTPLHTSIASVKPFWEVLNAFPFASLKVKDSAHFFKRGVKPLWEDPRNAEGGSWTFRVPKAKAEEFFKQVLFMAVGEQFADVLDAGKST